MKGIKINACISQLPENYITDFVMIFATFGKNPAKMNFRIKLTTDFIRGYTHFALPGQ